MSGVGVIVHQDKVLGGGLEELRSALADVGHPDPAWYEVAKSKEAPKKVRKLVRDDGVDRVLVWGGDGTVRRCIQTIIDDELDASIGILPAGTGNLLANNLGIPIEVRGARRRGGARRAAPDRRRDDERSPLRRDGRYRLRRAR